MSVNYEDEDRPFVTVLQSMGIEEFNALVPVSLNEYAARFAAEILRDSREYAGHAGRSDIYPEDIKLAVKLNDSYATNLDNRESVYNRARDILLKKNLTELADPRSVLIRYPADQYIQRAHTYVPGSDAYGDEEEEEDGEAVEEVPTIALSSTGAPNMASGVKFQPTARIAARRLDQVPGFAMDES